MMARSWTVLAALCLSSCGQPDAAPSSGASNANTEVLAVSKPRFSDTNLAKARKGIEAEPLVVDYLLDPEQAVELTVAVRDDGTRRYGYAGYYCLKLRDWGIYDYDMDVRIVDAAKIDESDGDWRSISLGTVSCRDERRWD